MSNRSTLAQRLTEARSAKNLTIEQAARRASVTVKTLRSWENGRTEPRPSKLQMLAGILGVSISWLLNGGEEHAPIAASSNSLAPLEQKMQRLSRLQAELAQLNEEIAEELALLKQAENEEPDSLVA